MSKTKLNVLLTRPQKKSEVLAKKLAPYVSSVTCQPLFDFIEGQDLNNLEQKVTRFAPDIAIFISEASVKFTLANNAITHLLSGCQNFAIGNATANALNQANITDVLVAEPATSEGLLLSPILKQVTQKRVMIFRGNGGRELIASTLLERGAQVEYIESYQRHWLALDAQETSDQWKHKQINCIVVTSNEILMHLWQMLSTANKDTTHWQNQCTWYVVSERVFNQAKKLGIRRIELLEGANDNAVIKGITQ